MSTKINWEELPLILKPVDVFHVLGVGKNTGYALFHKDDFPSVKVGRSFRIGRDALRRWLENGGKA